MLKSQYPTSSYNNGDRNKLVPPYSNRESKLNGSQRCVYIFFFSFERGTVKMIESRRIKLSWVQKNVQGIASFIVWRELSFVVWRELSFVVWRKLSFFVWRELSFVVWRELSFVEWKELSNVKQRKLSFIKWRELSFVIWREMSFIKWRELSFI